MRACGVEQGLGARALYRWCGLLRRQGLRAGLRMNDWMLGLAWSGAMSAEKLIRASAFLPAGLGEIYFHPATSSGADLAALMPGYDHIGEFRALLDEQVKSALETKARLRGWLSPR